MFAIIGIVIVFGAVIGGFLMEKGPLLVLMQPSELVIIGGAAIGTLLVANPLYLIKKIVADMIRVLGGSKFSKNTYLDTLKMMFSLFTKARKEAPSSPSTQPSSRTTTSATSSATPCAWPSPAAPAPSTWTR